MNKVLLHVCCGSCSLGCLDRLKDKTVIAYFSNSNIWPHKEFEKRLKYAKLVGEIYDFDVINSDYSHEAWREAVKGLEQEPERGARCLKCFEFGLRDAFQKARELGINDVTSTLSVSRYKVSPNLFKVGRTLAKEFGMNFLEIDFKKKGGFEKSRELSKKHDIYMQDYCGCEFSFAGKTKQPAASS